MGRLLVEAARAGLLGRPETGGEKRRPEGSSYIAAAAMSALEQLPVFLQVRVCVCARARVCDIVHTYGEWGVCGVCGFVCGALAHGVRCAIYGVTHTQVYKY